MIAHVDSLIEHITSLANQVASELGIGWKEAVYQKAMEVSFREAGISYESQRIIPVSYMGYNVGEGIIDLLPFFDTLDGRIYIVVDLDSTAGLKETDRTQVIKYMKELGRELRSNDMVYEIGMKINFCKKNENSKIKDGMIESDCLQVLHCNYVK